MKKRICVCNIVDIGGIVYMSKGFKLLITLNYWSCIGVVSSLVTDICSLLLIGLYSEISMKLSSSGSMSLRKYI